MLRCWYCFGENNIGVAAAADVDAADDSDVHVESADCDYAGDADDADDAGCAESFRWRYIRKKSQLGMDHDPSWHVHDPAWHVHDPSWHVHDTRRSLHLAMRIGRNSCDAEMDGGAKFC